MELPPTAHSKSYMTCKNRVGRNVLIFVLSITLTVAQRIGYEVPERQLNRRFSLSTHGPLAEAINDLTPDIIPHVGLILHHVTRVENAVRESLVRPRVDANAPVQPCEQEITVKYRSSIWRSFSFRGFAEPAFNCASDVHGVLLSRNDEPGYTLDDLYEAIFNRGAGMKRRVKELALRVIDNFTSPGIPFNYTYKTMTAHCSVSAVCLTREGEHWRNSIPISSADTDHFLFDGQQQNIAEYVRVVDGKLGDHMMMRLPVYDDGTIERVILDNTTTVIQSWGGNPNPSCFQPIPVTENPAMLAALDLADHSSQIAEGALTTSNLAILLLPLGLNLIPLSLIAEVSTTTLLLYTILSDVLTVTPLGIKGAELVMIEKRKYRSVVTRVVSPELRNSSRPYASGGEMWGAECGLKNEVRETGYALIFTALAFLVFGVSSEVVAKRYAAWRRRKREWTGKLEDGDVSLFTDGDVSCWDESVASSWHDSGITGEDDIGTGAGLERYSVDLEREESRKRRVWLFR